MVETISPQKDWKDVPNLKIHQSPNSRSLRKPLRQRMVHRLSASMIYHKPSVSYLCH